MNRRADNAIMAAPAAGKIVRIKQNNRIWGSVCPRRPKELKEKERNEVMIIAVASMKGQVAQHFGHCEAFLLYNTDNNQTKTIPNPGHKPGFLPNFLGDQGIEVIIAGGMGAGAIEIFHSRNIQVVTGAQGGALEAAQAFSRDELDSTGAACEEHGYHQE